MLPYIVYIRKSCLPLILNLYCHPKPFLLSEMINPFEQWEKLPKKQSVGVYF